MGALFGKIDIKDDDLAAIGVMVEESTKSVNRLSDSISAIAKAIEAVAAVVRDKKASAFWGLVKIE